ncbi:unnamed protein product [Cuscuta campestris]|uniref:Vta1/callose synthase N-terminal domain-containing protein n=2 Tax=Cuscuta sect. Cleistogrammica TaxID=1824901 RepID=A0A484M1R1_9ASTE|nr:hypothetical protein DM860_000474 [Cuscuta australis]VFQ82517.1 unnamed protein product [Cuscuta campestris]
MAKENEPAKLLLPYLQRADELQKHEPLVAYYCRLYAMERGLRIPQSDRTKTTNSLLVSLINQLEKDKKSLQLGPDDHLHVEGFALNVFSKADKQDRTGRADLNTAKTFYAASIFFEILNQFGEIQPDLEQKQKYAAWKAADIRKALKEGRKPVPGPPGGEKDSSDMSTTPTTNEYDLLEFRRSDSSIKPSPELNSSPHQAYGNSHSPSLPHSYSTEDYPSRNFQQLPPNHVSEDDHRSHNSFQPPPPPSNESEVDYQVHHFQQPPPNHNAASPSYPHPQAQPYNHQPYTQETTLPQQHYHHPSQDVSSPYSYPNFQSYPSFAETSLPSTPSHYPSYYQGTTDASSSHSMLFQPSNVAAHPSTSHYNPSNTSGPTSESSPPGLTKTYQYDSNYQPTPDKISEAHKAARFAVGALAFDDVSVAVDYLKKSLELLTNPSAEN